jgi:hypothetical protein
MVDANGFPVNASLNATVAAGTGTTVVKASAGRLVSAVVTGAASTGALTFYDNASTGSGTVIGVVPASAGSGTRWPFETPAVNGITAVGAAGSAAVTVSYS